MTPDQLLLLSEWLRELALGCKPASEHSRTIALHLSLAAEHSALALQLIRKV